MSKIAGDINHHMIGKACSHGKLWTEYCKDCEIVDTRRMLQEAQRRVANLQDRLDQLQKGGG
jgi:tryptophanyl-tRNA synthetase